jgi:hypothetical protein
MILNLLSPYENKQCMFLNQVVDKANSIMK